MKNHNKYQKTAKTAKTQKTVKKRDKLQKIAENRKKITENYFHKQTNFQLASIYYSCKMCIKGVSVFGYKAQLRSIHLSINFLLPK